MIVSKRDHLKKEASLTLWTLMVSISVLGHGCWWHRPSWSPVIRRILARLVLLGNISLRYKPKISNRENMRQQSDLHGIPFIGGAAYIAVKEKLETFIRPSGGEQLTMTIGLGRGRIV